MSGPLSAQRAIIGAGLATLRRATGLPLIFAGTAVPTSVPGLAQSLVLSMFSGEHEGALSDLEVAPCSGLGGRAAGSGRVQVVANYAGSRMISHEYDRQVVERERLASMFAYPVVVGGEVAAVLYGASRSGPIGDVAIEHTAVLARRMSRELRAAVSPGVASTADAVALLGGLIAHERVPAVRRRLGELRLFLSRSGAPVDLGASLSPREIDVLRLVARGLRNGPIAAELGLGEQTVKSYLRNAMKKLNVSNRAAAAVVARSAGVI